MVIFLINSLVKNLNIK